MGYFDLPRGELELQLKDAKGIRWESVMFTDSLTAEDVASCVEDWSVRHEVMAARYNGKAVQIPKGYHWEIKCKDETIDSFATRKECADAWNVRRRAWNKDKTVKLGIVSFVKD